jgi:protein-tyrosine kinase
MNNIYFLEGAGFWLLPAGNTPENPLELMQAGRLPGLFDQLGAWFDWVIVDSPPLLPLADTSVWSRFVDGILLVVREGRTERQELRRGLGVLDHSRLLGVVVNSCTDTHHQDYYSRYSYAAPPSET